MIKDSLIIFLLTTVLIFLVDFLILKPVFNLGYTQDYEQENLHRSPTPYIEFKGKPGALDHDIHGYRWVPTNIPAKAVRIAFFGGSSGYKGKPPIASLLQEKLSQRTGTTIVVANFSVVSSNHRQHLHNLIESRDIFEPDFVIFYGGYNETIQNAYYDPRPGYPYNYFFRAETAPSVKWLLAHSAIFGLIDRGLVKYFKISMTPLGMLRRENSPFSDAWNGRVVEKYFKTLELAKYVTEAFPSEHCGKGTFLSFYQPFQYREVGFEQTHNKIQEMASHLTYVFDVSRAYDSLGKDVYEDIVHVKQSGNELMAELMATIIIDNNILDCTRGKRVAVGSPVK